MLWTPLAMVLAGLSSAATGLLAIKLTRDWDVRVSSVRWLFALFFAALWLSASARCAQYAWVVSLPAEEFVDSLHAEPLSVAELDQLGVYATFDVAAARAPLVSALLCLCDVAHFGAALWALPLAHELAQLAFKSMDGGVTLERRKIRRYTLGGHTLQLLFLLAEVAVCVAQGGYSVVSYRLVLAVYLVQIATLVYLATLLLRLRRHGRNVEPIHGHFQAAPVYQRLKRIMFVYAVFALQFELASLYAYCAQSLDGPVLHLLAVSQVAYNATGLMLAVVTGASLPCVLRLCGPCLPPDVEAQLAAGADSLFTPCGTPLSEAPPPLLNPVFVVTDVESSSALWAIGDGRVMQQATQVHDDVMRSLLASHRGYEIATAGDSFQLAFHTIREAVGFCLAAQLQLLAAKWPTGLDGLVPATKTKRAATRVVFRGLRVRMGVHDAMGSDGPLATRLHAVTGKLTYTGASEVMAAEVSDLAAGGQVLVTKRIADWLVENSDIFPTRYAVHYVCDLALPQVDTHLQVFQVAPDELARRVQTFNRELAMRVPGSGIEMTPRGSLTSLETISASLHDRPSRRSGR